PPRRNVAVAGRDADRAARGTPLHGAVHGGQRGRAVRGHQPRSGIGVPMELRFAVSVCLVLGCASEPTKRLVIPEEMKRPLATGQSVGEASAGNAQGSKIAGVDRYAVGSDDPARAPRPAAAAPTTVAGATTPKPLPPPQQPLP